MASPIGPNPIKRRAKRKRLPPLPPASNFQFVVATHPNHFKAPGTMRNVRSHVMYRYCEGNRGLFSGDESKGGGRSRTGSFSDSLTSPRRHSTRWDDEIFKLLSQSHQTDPLRNVCAKIISAMTLDSSHNIPVTYGKSTEYHFSTIIPLDLKNLYLNLVIDQGK